MYNALHLSMRQRTRLNASQGERLFKHWNHFRYLQHRYVLCLNINTLSSL